MRIIGLVGKSGTGKSTAALKLARQENIDYILDDGLLIKVDDRCVVEGVSAKGYASFNDIVKIMKIALFSDIYNANKIIESIANCKPESLLILGISNKMIKIIQNNLQLPQVEKIVKIEDINSEKEINDALKARSTGKYSIPIAVGEISKALGVFRNSINETPLNYTKIDNNQKEYVEITRNFIP